MDKIYQETTAKPGNPAARDLLLIYGALPLAYIITGHLGLVLAVSPGYATAVFLPAGIGVGAAFIMGVTSVPGTFLGSFLLNVWTGYSVHTLGAVNLGTAAIIASASALQAGIGGALLRREIGYPTPLDTLRDVLFFLLLSPCICLTSATISNGGMWLAGVLQSTDIAVSWMTWWGGDTLGVLVVVPIMLVFAGKPRRLWRLRIWYVAVPMILCFALFVSFSIQAKIWQEAQLSNELLSTTSLARHEAWQNWLILTAGVLSTGMLGALLMLGTGQANRVRVKQEELETVLGGTPFMLTRCGRDLRYRFISESYGQMLGLRPKDVLGKTIPEVVGDQAFKTMLPYIEKVLQGNRVEYERDVAYQSTPVRTVHTVYVPDENEDGEVIGWIASILDITNQKEAQKRERTLLMELQHRSNNLLAIVQSIAHRSLANGHSLDDAKKAFESRLQALAKANRQLTKSNWRGVGLREIVRLEMEPFGDRTSIAETDVVLAPKQAQYLSLALHELATNAAKYGALSNANGKVCISWTTTEQSNNGKLYFKWRESGGPPVVVPARQGFGTALIKATFPDAQIDYAVEGFSCEIHLLLGNDPFLSIQDLAPDTLSDTSRQDTELPIGVIFENDPKRANTDHL
jgi:PAS domain S-box-containing protein